MYCTVLYAEHILMKLKENTVKTVINYVSENVLDVNYYMLTLSTLCWINLRCEKCFEKYFKEKKVKRQN